MQILSHHVSVYQLCHFIRVSAYPLSKNPLNNSYCVPAIHLVIHLKQLVKNTVCLFDVLKATEGKKKNSVYKG